MVATGKDFPMQSVQNTPKNDNDDPPKINEVSFIYEMDSILF